MSEQSFMHLLSDECRDGLDADRERDECQAKKEAALALTYYWFLAPSDEKKPQWVREHPAWPRVDGRHSVKMLRDFVREAMKGRP